MTIYTVGHSTRSLDDLVALLLAHGVRRLADIRSFPRSRRHPQFNLDSLERTLPSAGIAYRHFPALGGRRRARRNSPNRGWQNEAFRGYADHMLTAEFSDALDALLAYAVEPTAVMCAEAVWWQCHRQLLADALVVRDVEVKHITSPSQAASHTLTSFARPEGGKVFYPGLLP